MAVDIEIESRRRKVSKSDVVRDRLRRAAGSAPAPAGLEAIADLIGAGDGLAPDLSGNVKAYLRKTGYGRKHAR
ncbi:MAG: hypothetical protein ACREHE_02280 [Rhizomicrobium sp.]